MGDLLQSGAEWLAGKLKQHAAREVVYRRGTSSCTLKATVGGGRLLKLTDGYGGTKMVWTSREYIIDPIDLVLDGVTVRPQSGDTIEETVNGTPATFEVLTPGGNEDFYKMGAFYRSMRIHTKERG